MVQADLCLGASDGIPTHNVALPQYESVTEKGRTAVAYDNGQAVLRWYRWGEVV